MGLLGGGEPARRQARVHSPFIPGRRSRGQDPDKTDKTPHEARLVSGPSSGSHGLGPPRSQPRPAAGWRGTARLVARRRGSGPCSSSAATPGSGVGHSAGPPSQRTGAQHRCRHGVRRRARWARAGSDRWTSRRVSARDRTARAPAEPSRDTIPRPVISQGMHRLLGACIRAPAGPRDFRRKCSTGQQHSLPCYDAGAMVPPVWCNRERAWSE